MSQAWPPAAMLGAASAECLLDCLYAAQSSRHVCGTKSRSTLTDGNHQCGPLPQTDGPKPGSLAHVRLPGSCTSSTFLPCESFNPRGCCTSSIVFPSGS